MMTKRRVFCTTLGCPKNQVDTEMMLGMLARDGHEMVLDPEAADVLLINTCGFIEASKVESIDVVLEMARVKEKTGSRLVVAGCLAQRYPDELQRELPEVDAFVGTGALGAIARAVADPCHGGPPRVYNGDGHVLTDGDSPRLVLGAFYSAYLKIAEGCSRQCSFCIIPAIRGRQKSRPIERLVAEAQTLARQGVVELNLVAQDLTAYGRDRGEETLVDLLRALVRVDGIAWIRLLYAYPQHLTDPLLNVIAGEPKMCPYIDMPLQHISDRVLRTMRRGRSGQSVRKLVARLRRRVPDLVLRTSFIVGFPGETDGEFEELVAFVKDAGLDHVGVFRYSREEGTAAAALPHQVPARVKTWRYRALMGAQAPVAAARNRSRVGGVDEVLVTRVGRRGRLTGRSRGQAPDIDGVVMLRGDAAPGDVVRARITGAETYDLHGEIIGAARVDMAAASL